MAKRKRKSITKEQIADALDAVADRVMKEDFSFDIQVTVAAAELGLIELRHVEGLKLLGRISLLLLTKNKTANAGYDYVRKQMESMDPLNPVKDAAALKSLADELRGQR